jgi:hypothetical protein
VTWKPLTDCCRRKKYSELISKKCAVTVKVKECLKNNKTIAIKIIIIIMLYSV